MSGVRITRGLLAVSSGWLLLLACGSRTGLLPGNPAADGGAAGVEPAPPPPECVVALDCPQPLPGQCGSAGCTDGRCRLDVSLTCDDGDPCTVDTCEMNRCVFADGRVDADGDGAFARGTAADPQAPLGCGDDCDDSDPNVFPGAVELCDSVDNDCNGVADEGTGLTPTTRPPVRVSPDSAELASAAGLAFDGTGFGATMSVKLGTWQGHFRRLDANGNPLGDSQRVARINAESYGGPLLWTGERYLTAYSDARQDGNYEIYFNLLNAAGQRLNEDLRVTNADDFSLRPSLVWTGAESLLVWDDRRFEGRRDQSALFGQRISSDGRLLGGNVRLTPADAAGESASVALSDSGVGIAFVALDDGGNDTRVKFLTASRGLERPSAISTIDFVNATNPTVTAVGGKYVVTFHEANPNIGPSIFGVVIGPGGVELGPRSMTVGGLHARDNATYSYGDRFVMVWADDLTGRYQLYAQIFDAQLSPLSPRMRVTSTDTLTRGAALAPSSDGGLGILYSDETSQQTFFTRLDCIERFQL